ATTASSPASTTTAPTSGTEADESAASQRLATPFYIGMIGSRKKVNQVMSELQEAGHTREQLSMVHTPIGVEIFAETPQEIAISILAEVIREWRLRQPGSVRTRRSPSETKSDLADSTA